MNLTDTYPQKYTAYFTAVRPIDFIVSPTIFANYIFVIRIFYYKRESRIVLSPSYLRTWIRASASALSHGNFVLFDCFVVHTAIVFVTLFRCLCHLFDSFGHYCRVCLSSFNVTLASCNYFLPILCSTFHIKHKMCPIYATSMKRIQNRKRISVSWSIYVSIICIYFLPTNFILCTYNTTWDFLRVFFRPLYIFSPILIRFLIFILLLNFVILSLNLELYLLCYSRLISDASIWDITSSQWLNDRGS